MLEMFKNPIVSSLYSGALNFVIHILMLNIVFIWMDIKVKIKNVFICSLFGVIIGIFPIILTNYIISDPIDARIWIYTLFMYVNPFAYLLYYFIIKKVFKFSATRASITMYYQFLINYVITTIFLFLNDVFCSVFNFRVLEDGFYHGDYLSYLVIIIIWILVWWGMKLYINKSRKNLVLPPNYKDKKSTSTFIKRFIIICIIYIYTVFFRRGWFFQASIPISFTNGVIYITFIIAILLYIFNLTIRINSQVMEWEMQATGTYISSLLNVNQEFRSIKHDFYNVLQGYSGYIEIKDYEGLQNYHNRLFSTTKQVGDFLDIIEILRPRIAVYSLLESKSKMAKKLDVIFSVNCVCDVSNVVINDFDLCRILGIVIDNAIEEAELSTKKQVNLSIESKDMNTIVFAVSNTTKSDIDIKRIFEQGYTTKENHTGIGLPQVLHILNSYEHCSLRTNYHDNQFSIFLILNASKK